MPCRDYMDDNPSVYYGQQLNNKEAEIKRLNRKLSFAESALCAVLRAIENAGMDINQPYKSTSLGSPMVDWKDAGITSKELADWFERHKKADAFIREKKAKEEAAKLAKEKKQQEREAKKQKALEKLTLEERQLLGV